MALAQLSEEQVRTWTREEKDRWWLEQVYRGSLPQLTLRSGLTGFLLGGILASTNLYVGGKAGITLGVNVTSVILAFALFRAMSRAGLARDFTILENNAMQSIATAAGYMTSPLIASLAAFMLVTGRILPWWQMVLWMVTISLLGVLVAFPLKRRFINEDQMPFPEGRAAGVVLDALHGGREGEGMFKARVLAWSAAAAAAFHFVASDGWMRLLQLRVLRLGRWLGLPEAWHFRERFDEYYYLLAARFHLWIPRILGTDVRQLGLRLGIDLALVGSGGLMGVRISASMLAGAAVNLGLLAPWMIQKGDIAPRPLPGGGLAPVSRIEIVNQWSLWWAVSMMVVGSLVGLLGRPQMFVDLYRRLAGRRRGAGADVLRHIELPLWISAAGIPVLGAAGAWMSHAFFGAAWSLALASLPLIFVLAVIAANSMALTSWIPSGALAKVTQFSVGAIDRTNPGTNLSAAGMTAEVAMNAGNLLSDIKPGYMLGAKPRQQAVGHVIGILAGALASVPLFFLLFLAPGPDGTRSASTLVSDAFPLPAALQWKGVAEIIAHGVRGLPASAVWAMAVAAALAAAFEVATLRRRGRFPLSAVSLGLGVVLPFEACLSMFLGALFFHVMGRRHPAPGTRGHALWVECVEPICAGLIAGAALVGIGNAVLNALG